MDTLSAWAMGEANRGKEMMVFDWDKAARLIKESGVAKASAGLRGDWSYTGDNILIDGKPISAEYSWCYLASTWAVPELELDGYRKECYKMESETDGWDAKTFWPESALEILNG